MLTVKSTFTPANKRIKYKFKCSDFFAANKTISIANGKWRNKIRKILKKCFSFSKVRSIHGQNHSLYLIHTKSCNFGNCLKYRTFLSGLPVINYILKIFVAIRNFQRKLNVFNETQFLI